MKITERENLLLRRALDKATTPAEAETAAKAFIASLRARGIEGYDFTGVDGAKPAAAKPEPPPAQPEPYTDPAWWQQQAQAQQADWGAYAQAQAAQQQNYYRPEDYQNAFTQPEPPPPAPPERRWSKWQDAEPWTIAQWRWNILRAGAALLAVAGGLCWLLGPFGVSQCMLQK